MLAFRRCAAAAAASVSRSVLRANSAASRAASAVAPAAQAFARPAFPARSLSTSHVSFGSDSKGALKVKVVIPTTKLLGQQAEAAAVQQPAPHFEGTAVVDRVFKKISLDDYKGKYLILLFYPLDWTFVCPTEIIAFSDRSNEFKQLGTEIVACSVDSEASHLAWINTPRKQGGLGQMNIPLLADVTKKISRDYGVLLEDQGIALRGLYIIDPDGRVRIKIHHDLPIGRSVDEAKRLIEALQFHAKHGEVCPANWKKGSATIVPDHEKKLDYFGKVSE